MLILTLRKQHLWKRDLATFQIPESLVFCCIKMEFMREGERFKNFIIESLFTTNSFLRDNQFFSCKSEHIPSQSCSDKSNDTSDIPLDNSGLNRINQCNNNLIDEPIEDFIYSNLDINDEPKESLSDNIIADNKFNCDAHIVENTDDSNGNRNDDSNGNITLSNCFRPININNTHLDELVLYWIQYKNSLKHKAACF